MLSHSLSKLWILFPIIIIIIHIYNLLSLFRVFYISTDADQLGLDNLSGGPSMQRTDSSSLSSYWLPVVHHLEVSLVKFCISMLALCLGLSLCRHYLGQLYHKILVQQLCHVSKTLSINRLSDILAFIIFLFTLPWCSLSITGEVLLIGVGDTTFTFSLYFDYLWCSVAKRIFFCEEQELQLFMGTKINI